MALRPDKPATHAEGFEKAYAMHHPAAQYHVHLHGHNAVLPGYVNHLVPAARQAFLNHIAEALHPTWLRAAGLNLHNHGLVSPGLANALQNWHAANGRL
jgi:hypothetical protein